MENEYLTNENLQPFCEGLKELRIKLGLTQQELGEALGVRRPTIGSWEAGLTAPDVKMLLKIKQYARQHNITLDLSEMLGEKVIDRGQTPLDYSIHLMQSIDKMGIRGVYPNRTEALHAFMPWIEREERQITVVSSSFVGVLRAASQSVSELLRKQVGKIEQFRILMTHPDVSRLREDQEGRAQGSIANEVKESVENLTKHWGVQEENIKFYRGAPTVFLMFTSDRMILNPYTYQTEAFKTVTFEVAPTPFDKDNIYNQYLENHFRRAWENSNSISLIELRKTLTDGVQV